MDDIEKSIPRRTSYSAGDSRPRVSNGDLGGEGGKRLHLCGDTYPTLRIIIHHHYSGHGI
jgi:hypothetical protein